MKVSFFPVPRLDGCASPIDGKSDAMHKIGFGAGEVDSGVSNLRGRGRSSGGQGTGYLIYESRSCRFVGRGEGWSRGNGIHIDAAVRKLRHPGFGELGQSRLCGSKESQSRHTYMSGHRRDVDDFSGPSLGHLRSESGGKIIRSFHIGVEQSIEGWLVHLRGGAKCNGASIIDEDIDLAEHLDGLAR